MSKLKFLIRIIGEFGPMGMLRVVVSRVTGQPCVISFRRPELRHPISVRFPSSDYSTYQQIFDTDEYDFETAQAPRAIIDAGANIGLTAVLFANRYPDARIICLEPDDSNVDILRRNIAPYPNVVAVRAALWGERKELDLVDPGLGEWGFTTEDRDTAEAPPPSSGAVRSTVPALTVDGLLDEYDIDVLDLLKIDIEGAERSVFSSAARWIDRVDALVVELHERYYAGCNRPFYRATDGLDLEWVRGENTYVIRSGSRLVAPVDAAAIGVRRLDAGVGSTRPSGAAAGR